MQIIVVRNHDFDEFGKSDFVPENSVFVFEDVLDVLVAEAQLELLLHVFQGDIYFKDNYILCCPSRITWISHAFSARSLEAGILSAFLAVNSDFELLCCFEPFSGNILSICLSDLSIV
jgi:hypothetical protein